MIIIFNGNEISLPDRISLKEAVLSLAKKPEHLIAEVDGAIINRELWGTTILKDHSQVELITFVGGG